jgi:hypothetical protein
MKEEEAGESCMKKSYIICDLQEIILSWKIKTNEIEGIYSKNVRDEKCIENFNGKFEGKR